MTKSVRLICLILVSVSGLIPPAALTAQSTQTGRGTNPPRDPYPSRVLTTQPTPPPELPPVSPKAEGAWERAYTGLMAQDIANASGHANVGFSPAIMSIRGKAFTATRIYTNEWRTKGADAGDPATAEFTIARDEKGRVHYEMPMEGMWKGKHGVAGFDIQIYDPVAHTLTRYIEDADHAAPPGRVATVRKLRLMNEPPKSAKEDSVDGAASGTAQPAADPTGAAVGTPDPVSLADQASGPSSPAQSVPAKSALMQPPPVKFIPTKDNLPVQSVDGLSAVVHRVILKYGPNQQYFQIEENWLSPEYGMDLRRIVLRETINEETIETKNIIPGAPDPALFKVPAGYNIRREE